MAVHVCVTSMQPGKFSRSWYDVTRLMKPLAWTDINTPGTTSSTTMEQGLLGKARCPTNTHLVVYDVHGVHCEILAALYGLIRGTFRGTPEELILRHCMKETCRYFDLCVGVIKKDQRIKRLWLNMALLVVSVGE